MEEKEEYTQEYLDKQTAAKQWIEELIEDQIGEDVAESLRDGIVLCKLISVLCPTLEISVITSTPHKYRIMENISAFLEACTRLGFTYTELFTPPDLFEKKNMNKVLDTLKKIADYAANYDFPKWKVVGSAVQFSRTERRSIIGGDAAKSLPPKGSLPPKKTVMPTTLKNVRSLPVVSPPGGKPALRPSHPPNSNSPSLRASENQSPSISSSKEIPKIPLRAPLTSSRDVPQILPPSDTVSSPNTPKPIPRTAPSWEGLLSSSNKITPLDSQKPTIQETTPREEIVYNEVSLPPPRQNSVQNSTRSTVATDVPTAATAHTKPLPVLPSDPARISHHKSNSSSGLTLPSPSPNTAGHSRSKSHTTPIPVLAQSHSPNPASTSPPNISKMSSFQRVQQSLFLEEDLQNVGIRKSQPSENSSAASTVIRPSEQPARRPRPTSLTQPLRPLDYPARSPASPEQKDADEKSKRSSELRPEKRHEQTPEHRPEPRPERSEHRRSGNFSEHSERKSDHRADHRSDHRSDHPSDARSDTRSERSERFDHRPDRDNRSDQGLEKPQAFPEFSHSKAAQDLENQLKQTSDVREREALQRKIYPQSLFF